MFKDNNRSITLGVLNIIGTLASIFTLIILILNAVKSFRK